jgi:inorganic pyrophosphatase
VSAGKRSCNSLQHVRIIILGVLFILHYSCGRSNKNEPEKKEKLNYLHDIYPFISDSLVNVVIEIPAGTNEKWEVNKQTGNIECQQVTPDSLRMIDYLVYPANYGFVPQTLLSETDGGDGDPVDVFILGPSIPRGEIVKVRIVGIIHMIDDYELDPKLLAVDFDSPVLDVSSYEMLVNKYPGVVEIIRLWLSNYKGPGYIDILSVNDENDALHYLKRANFDYIELQTKQQRQQ